MNPIENSLNAATRLRRIKITSRIARHVFLAFFVFVIGLDVFFLGSGRILKVLGKAAPYVIGSQLLLIVWYLELARLFRFYERGAIFASKTIHCIKVLGVLCVLNWILYGIACALSWPPKAYGPSFFEIKTISSAHIFHMGFFSFDFGTGIDFGTLAAGIAIVLIAWIMDEGRKIQEEQELTV